MSKFPFDVLTDIFKQLPVKSLVRFRLLNKPICCLIDTPDFVDLHHAHALATRSHQSLILKDWHIFTADLDSLQSDPSPAASPFSHPLYAGGGTEAVGSCNGLVALRNTERDLALYNPSTRRFKRLPVSEVAAPPGGDHLKTGYVFYGFGYESSTDDYKLVRMVTFIAEEDDASSDILDHDFEVKVYSLKRDSWRKVNNVPVYIRLLHKPFFHVLHRRGYGVFAGGSVHWIVPSRSLVGIPSAIIAFDFASESFSEVSKPEVSKTGYRFQIDVGVLDGRLCVMYNYEHAIVDVWVMRDYGVQESWTRMLSIQRIGKINAFAFLRPLAYSKDKDKVLLEVNDEKLVWYDWTKNSAKFVKIREGPKCFGCEVYVESLVPLEDSIWAERQRRLRSEQEEEERRRSLGSMRDDFLSVGFKLRL